ncbi:DUF4169 family protein [Asticcacaulis sp. AND118]|uniref:DUF4169 family protein n=1 Tax=Asticcacaulis sp. AND118 TaxID=2840468 RepID=UPI001CFF8376|nr:DUF4169 family protein [Asticcacaulis sp. AND118]UDF02919.1 DUF4169 family protein [Asticcacaulis sp. AND118]
MSEVVNLNKVRKNRRREREKADAEQNRVIFGLPGHLRKQARENEALKARRLETQVLSLTDKNENS